MRKAFLVLIPFLSVFCTCGPRATTHAPTAEPTAITAPTIAAEQRSSCRPQPLPEPLAGDPLGATIHRLSNGLTVYISTDRSVPSISSRIVVRAGSRHDPAHSTGLAHYLEHMLFKGSGKLGSLDYAKEKPHLDKIATLYETLRLAGEGERAAIFADIDAETQKSAKYSVPNEYDNLYASLGLGGINAYTSDDQTVYLSTVPSNRFEQWAIVEGDRFSDPQFRLFYPELESVYEEKNLSLDSPNSRIYEGIAKSLFPRHPYGTQPTLGHSKHLKTPAYGDMQRFFDTWYRPNNMAIVLAGDIDATVALPILETYFAGLTPRELPPLPASALPKLSQRMEQTIQALGEESVTLAWPTVAIGHQDRGILDVMDLLVDNSQTGLLNIDLILSQKLPRAGSHPLNMNEAGLWVLSGTANAGQDLAEVETLLLEVVAKLKTGAFTDEDLQALVVHREMDNKAALESNSARAEILVSAFASGRTWPDVVAERNRALQISRADVIRVANTYLTDAKVVVKRVHGEFQSERVAKPAITAIPIDSSKRSAFMEKVLEREVAALPPQWLQPGTHYRQESLPAGPLIRVTNTRNDLFALSYEFEYGRRHDALLCFALELLERSGAGSRTPVQLQKELYALGASVQFYCGGNEMGMQIWGIDRNMVATLGILNTWIASPKFSENTLQKLVASTISKRKDLVREPTAINSALYEYALFGKHSDYLSEPSNAELQSTALDTLGRLVSNIPNLTHKTSYFGPRADAHLGGDIGLGRNHKRPAKLAPLRYRRSRKSTVFFVDQKIAQAQVKIVFPNSPIRPADNLKIRIFNQYVGGGMGGLIFQEIREARGLAYSAWANLAIPDRRRDESRVLAAMETQADKTVEALQTMLGLIAPVGIKGERFETTVQSLESQYRSARIRPRQRAASVYRWLARGQMKDPRFAEFKALHTTSAVSVQEYVNRYTKHPPTIVITGDRSRISLAALLSETSVEKIVTIDIAQLFRYESKTARAQ